MKIEKISVDNFTLEHDGTNHILNMGLINLSTPRPFIVKISEVKDSEKVSIRATCPCTTVTKNILDKTSLLAVISYNNCDYQFTKTVKITEGTNIQLIKITGTCQNQNT